MSRLVEAFKRIDEVAGQFPLTQFPRVRTEVKALPLIETPTPTTQTPNIERHVKLGKLLIDERAITHEQLAEALADQQQTRRRIGRILVDMGVISEEKLTLVLARQFGLEALSGDAFEAISPQVVKLIPEGLAKN